MGGVKTSTLPTTRLQLFLQVVQVLRNAVQVLRNAVEHDSSSRSDHHLQVLFPHDLMISLGIDVKHEHGEHCYGSIYGISNLPLHLALIGLFPLVIGLFDSVGIDICSSPLSLLLNSYTQPQRDTRSNGRLEIAEDMGFGIVSPYQALQIQNRQHSIKPVSVLFRCHAYACFYFVLPTSSTTYSHHFRSGA